MATSISFRSGNKLETILFDVATAIRPHFENEITENPIERGSDVTDNSREKPDTVTLEVTVTDYPITVHGGGIGDPHEAGRASGILDTLLYLKSNGIRVNVNTTLKIYSNMMIRSIDPDSTKLKGAVRMTISFVETVIVDSQTVAVQVATRSAQGTEKGGKKAATPATEGEKRKSLADRLGHVVIDAFKKVRE